MLNVWIDLLSLEVKIFFIIDNIVIDLMCPYFTVWLLNYRSFAVVCLSSSHSIVKRPLHFLHLSHSILIELHVFIIDLRFPHLHLLVLVLEHVGQDVSFNSGVVHFIICEIGCLLWHVAVVLVQPHETIIITDSAWWNTDTVINDELIRRSSTRWNLNFDAWQRNFIFISCLKLHWGWSSFLS